MKGYNTSKDYELLWELIQEGYRVPGAFYADWCCIMHNGKDAFIDFLKIADKETFVSVCREKDIQFIPPITE